LKTKSALMKSSLLLVILAVVLAGCGGGKANQAASGNPSPSASAGGASPSASGSSGTEKSPADYKGEITMWSWGDYEKALIPAFNKDFPNIKVNVVVVPNADYGKKLQTTIASGGNMPDVSLMEISSRGQLMTLDAWENLGAAPYNANPADLADYALPLLKNEKGEIVTIQEDATMAGIAYKRDLAKKYFGTDDPAQLEKMFATWDDFLAKGTEVVNKSGGKVHMFSGLQEDGYRLLGGEYTEPFVKDGKLNVEPTFKPMYQRMEAMIKAKVYGNLESWSAPWNASFGNGSVIFYACPTWFVPFVIKPNDKNGSGNYGLIKAPVSYAWGGTGLSIPKTAKNKELAWQFIKWVTMSQNGAKAFKEVNSTMTLYKPAMDQSGFYSAPEPYFGGQDIMAKFIDLGKGAKSRPITKYDTIVNDSNAVVLKMLQQGATADEAYAKLVEGILAKAPELKP
jgi:multiple sugar transport system substrate-binding protein